MTENFNELQPINNYALALFAVNALMRSPLRTLHFWLQILGFVTSLLFAHLGWASSRCESSHTERPESLSQIVDGSLGIPVKVTHVSKPKTKEGMASLRKSGIEIGPDEVAIIFSAFDNPLNPAHSHVYIMTQKYRYDGDILGIPSVRTSDLIGEKSILFRFQGLKPEEIEILNQAMTKSADSQFALPKLTCVHAACSILRKGSDQKLPTSQHIYMTEFFQAVLDFSQKPEISNAVEIQTLGPLTLKDYVTRFANLDKSKKDEYVEGATFFAGVCALPVCTALYNWFF